jgi:hypothetical protein
MTRWHKSLPERFGAFPKHHQLLMVANELNRANNFMENPREYKNALERALELLDLLSEDPRWRPALRELRRGRQAIAQIYISQLPAELLILTRTLIQLDPAAWKMLQPASST